MFGDGAFSELAFSEMVPFILVGFFKVIGITRSFQDEAWVLDLIEVK